jgi:hypothetical protein
VESFLLILLTLDARTGDLVRAEVVGTPYTSIADCVGAAIERGPQRSAGPMAQMLVCRAADAFARQVRDPRDPTILASATDPVHL